MIEIRRITVVIYHLSSPVQTNDAKTLIWEILPMDCCVTTDLAGDRRLREGLQWGYGINEVTGKRHLKRKRAGGFAVQWAELRGGAILVRAINTWHRPAAVGQVALTEIYPEPKGHEINLLIIRLETGTKDREAVPCEWRTSSFNLVNPTEAVEIEVKPSRPLKDGYAYEIAVWRQLSDEEQEAQWNKYGPFVAYNKGVPAAYVYTNGRLKKPQASKEPPPVSDEALEKRFCVACGVEIPPSSRYCPTCGEKQSVTL
jgi:hypothetical protein